MLIGLEIKSKMTWVLAWASGRMKFLLIDVGKLLGRIHFMGKIVFQSVLLK